MFCPKCGLKVPDETNSCPECHARLDTVRRAAGIKLPEPPAPPPEPEEDGEPSDGDGGMVEITVELPPEADAPPSFNEMFEMPVRRSSGAPGKVTLEEMIESYRAWESADGQARTGGR